MSSDITCFKIERGDSMSHSNPEEFYKNIAHRYHWFFSSWDDVMKRQMEQLVPLLREYRVHSVLDCACGTGLQVIGLRKAGFDVVGSDLSEDMLAVAGRNLEKEGIGDVQLVQADFREINKKIDKKFDAVICMGNAIPHLFGNDEILKALLSIYGCLEDKGVAVIETRNYDKMIKDKYRFLPMRIHKEKDGFIISILYVFDYLPGLIKFNVVYLVENPSTGERKMEVEVVYYNPVSRDVFVQLMEQAGFADVQAIECGPNILYTAVK